jgi:hypothetical protein
VSTKFTPIASALINTSPGLGEGSGFSTPERASGPPVCSTSIAYMVQHSNTTCDGCRWAAGQPVPLGAAAIYVDSPVNRAPTR